MAAAYVEPVVNKLVDGQLMVRMGDGKVYTDFVIYQAEDHVRYIKEQEAFAERWAPVYCNAAEKAIEKLKETAFYSRRLERYMLIHIAQGATWNCLVNHRKPQVFPDRPNSGKWIAFGTIRPDNYMIPEEKRGKEEYSLSGHRTSYIDRYLTAKDLSLYNYESALYPYPKHSGFGYSSFQEVERDMLKLFYLIKKGIEPESVDLDTKMVKAIPLLVERGFLSNESGKLEVLVPCLTHEQNILCRQIADHAIDEAAKGLEAPMAEWIATHKVKIPAHLKSVPDQKRTLPYEPHPMMFVFEAIRRGLHPRDLGYPCPETVAVFD